MKENTPINLNNITEQNIYHSKKLSQQICDGYKFFMNSLNSETNKNAFNNRTKEINLGINGYNINKSTPLNNYFCFNKNKISNNINNNYNNSITFVKKSSIQKENKKLNIIPSHNKSKITFISPSYQNLSKNKLLNYKGSRKNIDKINNNIKKFQKNIILNLMK